MMQLIHMKAGQDKPARSQKNRFFKALSQQSSITHNLHLPALSKILDSIFLRPCMASEGPADIPEPHLLQETRMENYKAAAAADAARITRGVCMETASVLKGHAKLSCKLHCNQRFKIKLYLHLANKTAAPATIAWY
jgi:hypothetical protein